jgi:hypothetical protein
MVEQNLVNLWSSIFTDSRTAKTEGDFPLPDTLYSSIKSTNAVITITSRYVYL